MTRDSWQIGKACAIGGALCALVALSVEPAFWWLGIGAGIAGGYISWEFREAIRAIPRAWNSARQAGKDNLNRFLAEAKEIGSGLATFAKDAAQELFAKPHPFFHPSITLGTLLYLFVGVRSIRHDAEAATIIFLSVLMLFAFSVIAFVLLFHLSWIGSRRVERCFWYPFMSMHGDAAEEKKRLLEQHGYRQVPITYGNVLRWTIKGFGRDLLFIVWTSWTQGLFFIGRFIWHLFRIVHSNERVLCALDGTLGGTAIYLWLAHPHMSIGQQVVLVIFGGFIGAALGVLNWELVSKRWLKIAAN